MNRISWIFIGVSALIFIAIGFFFSRPNVTSAWQTYTQIQTAKNDLDAAAKKKEILTTLSKNNQLSNLYDIATKYIPESGDSSGLVIALSAMAGESNLKVDQLTFETAPPAGGAKADTTDTTKTETPAATSTNTSDKSATTTGVQEIKFNMTVSGTFPDFLNFLKSVESSSRLITFSKMSFSQSDTTFQAQLSGTAYYKKGNSLETTLENIKISQDTINKFQNLKSYGTPINLPTESGFGRTDPFAAP